MLKNRVMSILGLLVVASMVLAACGPAATEVPATAAPVATEAPTATPVPVRQGAWVDSVVFTSIDNADEAVKQLQADQIDVFAETVANPNTFKTVKEDANLSYATSFGTYTELTFNPVLKFTDGRLNPFGDPKIREAMNQLIDRNYIVQEIYGGLASTKLLPLNSAFPDYARYVDTARALEAKYAFNSEAAKAVIAAEMEANGATLGTDGKWMFDGKPVTIIFIIRIEDERKATGDYISGLLEDAGFTVDRQYKSRSDASPIWYRSNPTDGQWNVYTGGWITTAVSRDDATNFAYFYSNLGSGSALWQAYSPSEEFFAVSEKLWNSDFKDMDERGQQFRQAMELAMQDSVRVWLVDQQAFSPFKANVKLAYDLAGGISGSRLWPYTLRFTDKEGGEMRIAMSGILTEPWNPINGSNWISDTSANRATGDVAAMPDPYTGLVWPQRIEKAEVVAKEGLPITKSLDWVDLKFQPEITVPDDAWADWDASAQKFITVGEAKAIAAKVADFETQAAALAAAVDLTKLDDAALTQFVSDYAAKYSEVTGFAVDVSSAFASDDAKAAVTAKVEEIKAAAAEEQAAALLGFANETVAVLKGGEAFGIASRDYSTALAKTTVYYPADLFKTVKWHDGSPLSMADFVMGMIMTFDNGKLGSAIYDENAASNVESFLSHFKGVKIVSTDPLVIETYDDFYLLDAETMISTWWPVYSYGQAPWHNLAIGIQAETDNKLAFSSGKAETNQVEWTSFIAGPSLEILKGYADADAASGFIPYEPTLGQYVTADEAKARFVNLQTFYGVHNHFWLGTGPFILDKVFPVESTLTLVRNPDFVDPADKWAGFGEPKLSTVIVDGAGQVTIGAEASFDVLVTYADAPYPAAEIAGVKYLVFNAKNELVATGEATLVEDGKYQVVLSADVTKGLEAGSNKIEVAVSSNVVSIPTFASFEFVTAP
ncbi:MAG: hypothetical protein Fur0035_17280 [Anaerolineales bacterium]